MLVKYQVPASHVQALPHVQSSIHFHPQWLLVYLVHPQEQDMLPLLQK